MKLGMIRVYREMVYTEPETLIKAFEGGLVISVHDRFIENELWYILYHPELDNLTQGEIIPEYRITLGPNENDRQFLKKGIISNDEFCFMRMFSGITTDVEEK